MSRPLAVFLALALSLPAAAQPPAKTPGLLKVEFVYEKAPFPQCHAATIAEAKGGLVAAWFGGTRERDKDVGIWVSRHDGQAWSAPVEVANGIQTDGTRHPCWNPILFQPKTGPLQLFYKVGPSPSTWWGMLTTSDDGGKTWAKPQRLPGDFVGSTKNPVLTLADGTHLHPSSTENKGWRAHFERYDPKTQQWQTSGPINDPKEFGAIQPAVLTHPGGKLQALFRTQQKKITESWSDDGGKTWGKMTATGLPNNNSGISALTLADGRHLLVYNHTTKGRSPLNVAVSKDGKTWQAALVLENEPGEYSYPFALQTADGKVHVVYTWRRTHVRHVVIDPAQLVLRDMPDGQWPADAGTGKGK